MRQKRSIEGRPVIDRPTGPVIAADAIALLAGANYQTVVKVIAAIAAIQTVSGVPLEELLNFTYVPLEPVNCSDPGESDRAAATMCFIDDVAQTKDLQYLDYVLMQSRRFRRPS